jgi:hypothetical protein
MSYLASAAAARPVSVNRATGGSAYGSSAAAARPASAPRTIAGSDSGWGSFRPAPTPPPARQSSGNTQAPPPSSGGGSSSRGPLNWRDSLYNSQIASIQRALQDFETKSQTEAERYGQDFSTGLSRMGYRPGEGFQAMPNILEMLGPEGRLKAGQAASEMVRLPGVTGGAFDIEGEYDPYSAAARGTRSTRDEFAGRGTLRSSDFAKSFGDFQNRLNQQLEAMEMGRGRFAEDLVTDVSGERGRAQERREAAQRDAMMRAAIAAAGGSGF